MAGNLTQIRIKNAGSGKLFDGEGLMLIKSGDTGKWVYRYSHLGKRREMGLGKYPAVTLAEARRTRDAWASILASGRDPIAERELQQAEQVAERDKDDPTLADAIEIVFESRKELLRGGGTRGRWMTPLTLHVIPRIGRKRLSDLHQTDIRDALAPIWKTKHPTAIKARNRLRIVLRECQLMGYECSPFIVDAATRMLGVVMHKETPLPSTPWQEMPALFASLGDTASGECLRWMALTLVRMDGCRAAEFSEIDGDVWTVPEERVKGQRGQVSDFRVPLSPACLEIVQRARQIGDGPLLFPSPVSGNPLTAAALEKGLKATGFYGVPHGFRASFRTWVQDTDACAFEVSETVLGHSLGTKVQRSYARSDLLDRRRTVMDAWARFLTGAQQNVVALR